MSKTMVTPKLGAKKQTKPKAEPKIGDRRSTRLGNKRGADEDEKPVVKKVKKDEEIHQGGNQSKPAPKSTAKKVEVEKKAEKPKASDPKPSTTKSKADVPNSSKAKAIEPKSSTTTQKNSNEPNPKSTSHSRKEEIKASAPASAPASSGGKGILKLGDKLPKIVLLDHKEVEVDVGSLAGEKGIVIFLYPKADTPGCTNQACGFRDHFDQISELGYEIYGLSKDKPAAQQKWATKKDLNYTLLCDPSSKLIKRLGAFVQPNNTKRSHFIFEKGSGKLVDIQLGVKPAEDPANCLKFIKAHHK